MRTIARLKNTFLILVLAAIMPIQLYANSTNTIPANEPKTEAEAYASKLIQRLEEIKAMDKSNLTRADKKNLRKEVRSIKEELRTTGNGVYLSIGAIIIILLILILIL